MGAKSSLSLSLSGGVCVYVTCNESHRDDSKAVVYVIIAVFAVVVGGTTNQKERYNRNKFFTPRKCRNSKFTLSICMTNKSTWNRLVGNFFFYPSIYCVYRHMNPSIIISNSSSSSSSRREGKKKKSINCV